MTYDRGIGLEFKERGRLAEFFQKTREMYPDSSLHTDRILAVHLPNGCDCSHLVGGPAKQHDRVDAVSSTELLTDYDRILLRFGMHILWQL